MNTAEAIAAAANLRRELTNAGAHHDPAGMTDTDIANITAAVHQLATVTGGNQHQIHAAIHTAHAT
ncbi:hypothetical protein PV409_36825 [Streptomyces sp. ME02-6979.5a]|uniref:hypothetical protein n=1 Tax=Streptomyces sp. ME02-6979.5a TaxID=462925 RepID=UPI0029BEF689|nr:hypothetical protein [Streptomyces sp. ME02-6979.5a]MDX3343528.1 hypothetical protein [Streptomyces sp. ME02-6979.5a]